jgi:chromosome segregation ATPase
MTEPIKLPLRDAIIEGMGWRDIKGYIAKDDDLICRIERVVEQAAADLRERLAKAEADSNVWAERYRKAALERDEAQAELVVITDLAETRKATLDARTPELCQLMADVEALTKRAEAAEADKETLLNVWKGEEAEHAQETAERIRAEAELARLTELLSDVRAVEAELAEKSDELARLTTLRPLSEWKDGDYNVLWWYRRNDGGMYGLQSRFEHCLGWTPLPNVKEAKP